MICIELPEIISRSIFFAKFPGNDWIGDPAKAIASILKIDFDASIRTSIIAVQYLQRQRQLRKLNVTAGYDKRLLIRIIHTLCLGSVAFCLGTFVERGL